MTFVLQIGTCPVCEGTKHKNTDPLSDCTNCGGQYMWGKPTGIVRLRSDGTPCTHEYTGSKDGNCLHGFSCKHCGDAYQIDSGD
ncbi:hypothetical protein UFOVP276_208 [uncultured Caudovirales phage]|uniref:Uncharacterized protein n=1 Tax=uncultured Caudovirales phage TaxID=2100421 RepID=A0A6J5LEC0_9CAUD|nr:hypothetical protein UFOVP127_102 [uncultured Caudovirales phage]CAB4135252.1 hypothetical protein UFOVP276_208 [uncultured Caudovirales phage]